jgi:hypothetical protein
MLKDQLDWFYPIESAEKSKSSLIKRCADIKETQTIFYSIILIPNYLVNFCS